MSNLHHQMYRNADWFRISIFFLLFTQKDTKYDPTLIDYLLDLVSGSTVAVWWQDAY